MTATLSVDDMIFQIDASGAPVRFEYVRGRMKWEMSPASRHQMAIRHIERSVRPSNQTTGCACYALADVLIRFPDPDQSLKRPDIAIFCVVPPSSDEALTIIPEAVVEVISLGYEDKDIGPDGAPFYVACGVRDVLVVDPRLGTIHHYRPNQPIQTHPTPFTIILECGCRVDIPT
jgi:Uma2 family endonuclease